MFVSSTSETGLNLDPLIPFSFNVFVISAVECVCPNMELLALYLITANNLKLILHRSFCSPLQVIHVNSVTKFVGLQSFTAGLRSRMRVHIADIKAKESFFLFVTYATGLKKMNLAWSITFWDGSGQINILCRIEITFFLKVITVTIYTKHVWFVNKMAAGKILNEPELKSLLTVKWFQLFRTVIILSTINNFFAHSYRVSSIAK